LSAGDVVLSGGSPGSISMALAQIGKKKGVKVITICENLPNFEESVVVLKDHGAFAAVSTEYFRKPEFRRLISGNSSSFFLLILLREL
jgi:fatty acid/phospholipid biosynthesis enzyme